MATEDYACKLVARVIGHFQLTINSSEGEIKKALRAAHSGVGKFQEFTRDICPGVMVTYTGRKPIFPEWVKMPKGENEEWVNDHRWGEGPNESLDELLFFTKRQIVKNTGIDSWRVSWEIVKQYSPEVVRQTLVDLKETESGRGHGSPYTQDGNIELELAFLYGSDLMKAWYHSMHWKAYAGFVSDLNEVTKKFGKEQVLAVTRMFPDDYKDLDFFMPFVKLHSGDENDLRKMYKFWKWTRWVHASSKIETSEIMFLVAKFSQATINKILDIKKEEIATLQEDLRQYAIYCWLDKDSAEWIKAVDKDEAELTVKMADGMGVKVSLANGYIKIIMSAGLTRGQIECLIVSSYYNTDIIPCWDLLVLSQKFHEQILSVCEESRPDAVRILHKDPQVNTRWWPQAIDSNEFQCGRIAEKNGREGLEGIQRTRWLKERLGKNWISDVDEKLSWEESCEVIKNNPWLKTSLSFIDKEDAIVQLAAGKDLTFLRYVADQNEYDLLTKSFSKVDSFYVENVWQVIKKFWSEDIRGWFNQLTDAVGEELAWNYIGNRSRHDQLFFVGNILEKLSLVQLKCILLQVRHDFARFSQAINAYVPCEEGQKIQSFKEFVKFVELQKNNVVFSADMPQTFRDKIMEMLGAPGVDVQAVKKFYVNKSNWPLITGQEDASAVFAPRKEEFFSEPLERLIGKALGSKKTNTFPLAENPGALFKKLMVLAKSAGLKSAADLVKEVPRKIKEQVITLLREHKTPMGDVFTAEVLPKSDPRGWVIGDWTNCCMQFGSSKNNEYMRRRDMSYFIISMNNRPIAQSVVVAAAHQSRNGSTPTVEAAKIDNIDAIALDNVEVSHNFTQHNHIINQCYRDFWDHYGNDHHVVIGTSHNDTQPSNTKISMSWKPLRTMVYSDCFGNSQAYLLHKPAEKKQAKKEAQHVLQRTA